MSTLQEEGEHTLDIGKKEFYRKTMRRIARLTRPRVEILTSSPGSPIGLGTLPKSLSERKGHLLPNAEHLQMEHKAAIGAQLAERLWFLVFHLCSSEFGY